MVENTRSQSFDLNIEDVLSHWCVKDAIREFIANAIDETVLCGCAQPEIEYDSKAKVCLIRDYGRGLKVSHLTQNESVEKADAGGVIGRFGVGLKDALAVLYEHGAPVSIDSRHMRMTLKMTKKHGFDISTLHAVIQDSTDADFVGTQVIIQNVSGQDVLEAKKMFLQFNGAVALFNGTQGEIIDPGSGLACIYVNGLQIAEEEDFKFSYNITNLDSKLRKNLNRERNAVGRSAYTDAVKRILHECKTDKVWNRLIDDLSKESSDRCTEMGWTDVCTLAAKRLSDCSDDYVFMTQSERNRLTADQVEKIQQQGREVVIISDKAKEKAFDSISTIDDVESEYRDSFEFEFIDPVNLSPSERQIWSNIEQVRDLVKKKRGKPMPKCLISETMVSEDARGIPAVGLWLSDKQTIIIKRSQLSSKRAFLGTLLHEYCHYHSGFPDNTRDFENALTDMCGLLAEQLLEDPDKRVNPAEQVKEHQDTAKKESFFSRLRKH